MIQDQQSVPVLRVATQADSSAIYELVNSSDSHPWRLSLIEEALHSRHNWLLECRESRQVVGWLTASMMFEQTELELVVTDVHRRRQGLGRALLEQWLDWSKQQGCEEALLEVRESNLGAIKLYLLLGFEQVGIRKNYYPLDEGGSEHAVLMTCKLK